MTSQIPLTIMMIVFLAAIFIGGPVLFLCAIWAQSTKAKEEKELRRRQLRQLRELQDGTTPTRS